MRRALVIGRKHGETDFTTLVQPTDPRSANSAYKALLHEPGDIAEMQLWESDAITKRKTFSAMIVSQSFKPAATEGESTGSDSVDSNPAPDPEPESAEESGEDGPSLLPKSNKKK